ncbi:collagen alpha-4(VI) chain-like [Lineus longissimus]|uniref:collagen alpha-4(VI) chain-like n=1 Tax=Lineus longissimus TaxID=88925 RepID=UPI00315D2987
MALSGFTSKNGARNRMHKIGILITDGLSNDGKATLAQARAAKKAGVELYCVGAKIPSKKEINAIASKSKNDHVYTVKKFKQLMTLAASIAKKILTTREVCGVTTPAPSTTPYTGPPTTTTTVKSTTTTTVHGQTTTAAMKTKSGKCTFKADIYFMIDSSGSVGFKNFPYLLKFVNSIIDSLPIGQNQVRVGVFRFNQKSTLMFPLNRFYNKATLKTWVNWIRYTSGSTGTDKVLRQMRQIGFTPKNGMRPNVHNVGILITDGLSNNGSSTITQAKKAKKYGINMFCVGAQIPTMTEVNKIASKPTKDHVFRYKKFSQMKQGGPAIVKKICQQVNKLPPATPPPTTTTTTTTAMPCDPKADIYFMVDCSGSVGYKNWKHVLGFVNALIRALPVGKVKIRVGVYRFGSKSKLMLPLNRYYKTSHLQAAVKWIRYASGSTATDKALKAMALSGFTSKNGARPGMHKIGILITDGLSNDGKATLAQARAAKKAGVELYCVGAKIPSKKEINAIASKSKSDHVYTVKKFKQLMTLAASIAKKILTTREVCGVTTPAPSTTPYTGPPTTTTTVKSTTTTTVHGQTTTTAMQAKSGKCTFKADIYFMIDSSGSVGFKNFPYLLKFVNSIIDSLPIGQNQVRVGVFRFNQKSTLMFPLNRFYNKATLKTWVNWIRYTSGSTGTDKVLKQMRQIGFTPKNGMRPNVHNVGILITDGLSNNGSSTITQAKKAKKYGINMFCVGAQIPTMTEVNKIASKPTKYHVFRYKKFSQMKQGGPAIVKKICQQVNKLPPATPPPTTTTTTTTAMPCDPKADIYFMVDCSGSVGYKNWKHVLGFVNALIRALPVGKVKIRVGVYRFGSKSKLMLPLNRYYKTSHLQAAVKWIRYASGSTATDKALKAMALSGFTSKNGARPGMHKIGILITDGLSNDGKATLAQARAAKKAGVELYCVGAKIPSKKEINAIASKSKSDHVYTVKKFKQLMTLAASIAKKILTTREVCGVTTPAPSTTPYTGPPTTTTTVKSTTTTTVHGQTTTAAKQTKSGKCTFKADIYFMIDSSGSVGFKNFPYLLKFVNSIIDSLPIGQNQVRVGVFRFNQKSTLMFPLNRFYNKATLKTWVNWIRYTSGSTGTDKVLKQMRQIGFTPKNGMRPNVHNVGILITDGLSNNGSSTITQAKKAKKYGINMFCVGAQIPTMTEVNKIASKPTKDHVFRYKKFSQMKQGGPAIVKKICQQVNKLPPATPPPTTTTTTTTAMPCDPKADIYFMVDCSGSVGYKNWKHVLGFVNALIRALPVGKVKIRVGVYRFGSKSKLMLPLNRYYKTSHLQVAVKWIRYASGSTATDKALKAMALSGFTSKNGARPGMHKIGILITDGLSNDGKATLAQARAAKKAGVELYCVGAKIPSKKEIIAIASKSKSKHVYTVKKFKELKGQAILIAKRILTTREVCARLTTSSGTTTPTTPGVGSTTQGGQTTQLNVVTASLPSLTVSSMTTGLQATGTLALSTHSAGGTTVRTLTTKMAITLAATHRQGTTGTTGIAGTTSSTLTRTSTGAKPGTTTGKVKAATTRRATTVKPVATAKRTTTTTATTTKATTTTAKLATTAAKLSTKSTTTTTKSTTTTTKPTTTTTKPTTTTTKPTTTTTKPPPTTTTTNIKTTTAKPTSIIKLTTASRVTGTTGKPPPCNPKAKVDIYFMIDASGSVRSYNFPHMLNFVAAMINFLPIGQTDVRVGVFRFDHQSSLIFPLNRHYSKAALMRAVRAVRFTGGGTSTQFVLRDLRTVGFTAANGDRPGVHNIGILVTDGISWAQQATLNQATLTKRAGVELFCVGVQIPSTGQIYQIASKPVKKHVFVVKKFVQMSGKAPMISKKICKFVNKHSH